MSITSIPVWFHAPCRSAAVSGLLFAVSLGFVSCKLRDTSGYCQLECEKTCPRQGVAVCVATNDPAYGCSSDTCQPCKLESAKAVCAGGRCAIGGCEPDFADCDGEDGNGCEVDYTSDIENCGACGTVCPGIETHASYRCNNGLCAVESCLDGFKNCNGSSLDGCEGDPSAECSTDPAPTSAARCR